MGQDKWFSFLLMINAELVTSSLTDLMNHSPLKLLKMWVPRCASRLLFVFGMRVSLNNIF